MKKIIWGRFCVPVRVVSFPALFSFFEAYNFSIFIHTALLFFFATFVLFIRNLFSLFTKIKKA